VFEAFPRRSVDAEQAFHAYAYRGCDLFSDMEAGCTAHGAEERIVVHRGGNASVKAYRPIVGKLWLLHGLGVC